jgi:hypothetical protein
MSQNTVISSSSTQYYTQSSAGSQYDSDENFMKHAFIVSLADMKKLKKVRYQQTLIYHYSPWTNIYTKNLF